MIVELPTVSTPTPVFLDSSFDMTPSIGTTSAVTEFPLDPFVAEDPFEKFLHEEGAFQRRRVLRREAPALRTLEISHEVALESLNAYYRQCSVEGAGKTPIEQMRLLDELKPGAFYAQLSESEKSKRPYWSLLLSTIAGSEELSKKALSVTNRKLSEIVSLEFPRYLKSAHIKTAFEDRTVKIDSQGNAFVHYRGTRTPIGIHEDEIRDVCFGGKERPMSARKVKKRIERSIQELTPPRYTVPTLSSLSKQKPALPS